MYQVQIKNHEEEILVYTCDKLSEAVDVARVALFASNYGDTCEVKLVNTINHKFMIVTD